MTTCVPMRSKLPGSEASQSLLGLQRSGPWGPSKRGFRNIPSLFSLRCLWFTICWEELWEKTWWNALTTRFIGQWWMVTNHILPLITCPIDYPVTWVWLFKEAFYINIIYKYICLCVYIYIYVIILYVYIYRYLCVHIFMYFCMFMHIYLHFIGFFSIYITHAHIYIYVYLYISCDPPVA